MFVFSIVETVNSYVSNPDFIKRSKTYWILHRSLVIVSHYGRVKNIWGRTFAWPAIFQGKKGTTGEQSKSASQIRDVWPCWITKISCSLWVQSKASRWIKQKIWWAEFSPCCSSFYLVEFPHSVSFNFERLHFNEYLSVNYFTITWKSRVIWVFDFVFTIFNGTKCLLE